MNATSQTVFVIDDQDSVRFALSEMLSVLGFRVQTFASAEQFLRDLGPATNGCLVADVRMPGMDGIALVRELVQRKRKLPVVLISGQADVPMAVAGIKAGADDFIEKPIDDVKLIAAINRGFARNLELQASQQSEADLKARFGRLTARQTEIFDHVVQGFTSHAIAEKLGISTRTVESYRAEVMEKMQAESLAMLVRQAVRLGRIAP